MQRTKTASATRRFTWPWPLGAGTEIRPFICFKCSTRLFNLQRQETGLTLAEFFIVVYFDFVNGSIEFLGLNPQRFQPANSSYNFLLRHFFSLYPYRFFNWPEQIRKAAGLPENSCAYYSSKYTKHRISLHLPIFLAFPEFVRSKVKFTKVKLKYQAIITNIFSYLIAILVTN